MGDINNDGAVDSTDRSQLSTALHHSTSYDLTYADMNGDGLVSAIDLYLLDNQIR